MELSETTALVTGGARRVGRAIALALAGAGAALVLQYNNSSEEAEATDAEAETLGAKTVLVGADLSEPSAAAEVIACAGEMAPIRV